MSLKNIYNFWLIRKEIAPSKDFRASLENKLMSKWDELNPTPAKSLFANHAFRLSVSITAGLLVVASAGTGAYAYTSPNVSEGSVLYPIKQGLENVEEKVRISPESRAKFMLKKVQRREAELASVKRRLKMGQTAAEEKILKIEKKIDDLDDKMSAEEKVLENVNLKNPQIKEKIKERIEKRKRRMENLMDRMQ